MKNIIILLMALINGSICCGGVISPGGGAYPVNSGSGRTFTYFPSSVVNDKNVLVKEPDVGSSEWSVTGKVFILMPSSTVNKCVVKSDKGKLDPTYVYLNEGTVECRGDMVSIQGIP